jgi:hypothetical protein
MGYLLGPDGEEFRNYFGMSGTLSAPAGSGYIFVQQNIEDARTLAGQTVTVSFWAKADAAGTLGVRLQQGLDNGGSGDTEQKTSVALDTVWKRRSVTVTLPTLGTKTVGPNSYLAVKLDKLMGTALGLAGAVYVAGVQLEAGPIATPFDHVPYGDELARCQRHLRAYGGFATYDPVGWGTFYDTTHAQVWVPCTMRAVPTVTTSGTWSVADGPTAYPVSAIVVATNQSNPANGVHLTCTVAAATVYRPARLDTGGSPSARLYLSAEL